MWTPLPCPFCGSVKLSIPSDDYRNDRMVDFYLTVRCLKCQANGPYVRVIQMRANGQRYAHTSRRPRSPEGIERWQATIAIGASEARRLWNQRGGILKPLEKRPARDHKTCQAAKDGECHWQGCPQLRDHEPYNTGRHCPLDTGDGHE